MNHSIGAIQPTADEPAMLGGDAGPARPLAMRIVCRIAPANGAASLLPIRAILGDVLYATYSVMATVPDAERNLLRTGAWFSIADGGRLTITRRET